VPRVCAATTWDLVVVGKQAPEILNALPEKTPMFTINRL
jgi:hypothetical protein